jgi:hypothetical protein
LEGIMWVGYLVFACFPLVLVISLIKLIRERKGNRTWIDNLLESLEYIIGGIFVASICVMGFWGFLDGYEVSHKTNYYITVGVVPIPIGISILVIILALLPIMLAVSWLYRGLVRFVQVIINRAKGKKYYIIYK